MDKYTKTADGIPPQADFLYYSPPVVSRVQVKNFMEKATESCVCIRVFDNFALLTQTMLEDMLAACKRSK